MLHVVDNLLPINALQELRDLCDIHGRLREQHSGDAQFSWRPEAETGVPRTCLLYTSPSPRDPKTSRMPSSA